jgi:hypothetical protein
MGKRQDSQSRHGYYSPSRQDSANAIVHDLLYIERGRHIVTIIQPLTNII